MSTGSSPLRQVLVPLDGSTLAEEALPVAGALARDAGADIHLVSVQPPIISVGAQFGLGEGDTPSVFGVREDLEAYLTLMTAKVARTRGLRAVTAVLTGDPAERLAEYVNARGNALVVMTTHGRGGFSRFWLGSVADRLVRRISAPVLLLRHATRIEDPAFERILIALDGTPASEGVLVPAMALGSLASDAHYTLVRVVEPPMPAVTPVGLYPADVAVPSLDELSAAAAEYLEAVAHRMREQGLSVVTRVLVGGVAEQIVGFAERSLSQLIAVGTRGARGLDRLMLGSVADKVVRSAVQPVLVVPAGSPRAASHERTMPAAGAVSSHTDNEVLIP